MHDRPIQWLTMRDRVAEFLEGHRSRVKVYRLCRRVMKDYEEEISRLKEWHELVLQIDDSVRQLRDMSRAKANEDPNMAEMAKITHLAVLEQSVNLRTAEEDLEKCRKGEDEVLASLDWVVPMVFARQHEVVLEWYEVRREKAA